MDQQLPDFNQYASLLPTGKTPLPKNLNDLRDEMIKPVEPVTDEAYKFDDKPITLNWARLAAEHLHKEVMAEAMRINREPASQASNNAAGEDARAPEPAEQCADSDSVAGKDALVRKKTSTFMVKLNEKIGMAVAKANNDPEQRDALQSIRKLLDEKHRCLAWENLTNKLIRDPYFFNFVVAAAKKRIFNNTYGLSKPQIVMTLAKEGVELTIEHCLKWFENDHKFVLNVVSINLGQIAQVFDAGDEITPKTLQERGVIKRRFDEIKVLGDGEVTKPFKISAHRFSKSALEKLKAAGGTATIVKAGQTTTQRVADLAKVPKLNKPADKKAEGETAASKVPSAEQSADKQPTGEDEKVKLRSWIYHMRRFEKTFKRQASKDIAGDNATTGETKFDCKTGIRIRQPSRIDRAQGMYEAEVDPLQDLPTISLTSEETAMKNELHMLVQRLVTVLLCETEQKIFNLRYEGGLSIAKVSANLGSTVHSVRSGIESIKNKFRNALRNHSKD